MEMIKIDKSIERNEKYTTYLGFIKVNNKKVFIKIPKKKYEDIIKYEFDIIKKIKFDSYYDLIKIDLFDDTNSLVTDVFSEVTLKDTFENKKIHIEEFLDISLKICDVIFEIHSRDYIHRKINSENILFNPTNNKIRVINFDCATKIDKNSTIISEEFENDHRYISPEQTGLVNISVDKRSDLYSLGMVLFELATGELPFSGDFSETIHQQVAKKPNSPLEYNNDLPRIIADIILKLINKDKQERYQNIIGLQFDLQKCLSYYKANKNIDYFKIASQDYFDQFRLIFKYNSRKKYQKKLKMNFEKLLEGDRIFTFIKGVQGIGKTKLVYNLIEEINKSDFVFINRGFEVTSQNSPYFLLVQIVDEIFAKYIAFRKDKKRFIAEMLEVVKENSKILTDISPTIKDHIGEQPPLEKLNPLREKERFNSTIAAFLKFLCKKTKPTVLFIDNVHLIDNESLKILDNWLIKHRLKYFWVICAYRDEELPNDHPLKNLIKSLEKQKYFVEKILLQNLTMLDLIEMIEHNISSNSQDVEEISKVIKNKTNGNPLFVYEFLLNIYKKGILTFDYSMNCWNWNINEIKKISISNNVIEMTIDQISELNDKQRNILEMASAIGKIFDTKLLTLLSDQQLQKYSKELIELELKEYIIKISEIDEIKKYEFSHNRVLNACYSLMNKPNREHYHYILGKYYLENLTESEIESRIFEIVKHFNVISIDSLGEIDLIELIKLNFIAGKKAKRIANYDLAYKYFRKSLDNINENWWELKYEFTFYLYLEIIEMYHLSNKRHKVYKLIDHIYYKAKSNIDKVKLLEIKIRSQISENELENSLKTAKSSLELLGIKAPDKLNKLEIYFNYIVAKYRLRNNSIINQSKFKTSEKLSLAIDIIILSIIPAYLTKSSFLPLIIYKGLLQSYYLDTEKRFQLYIAYSFIVISQFKKYQKGTEIANKIINNLDEIESFEIKGRIKFTSNMYIYPWSKKLSDLTKSIKEAQNELYEAGDIEFSASASLGYIYFSFLSGRKLKNINDELNVEMEFIRKYKQYQILDKMDIWQNLVYNFLVITDNPTFLNVSFNMNSPNINVTTFLDLNFAQLILAVYFHKFDKGLEIIKKVKNYKIRQSDIVFGEKIDFIFYETLVYLKLYSSFSKSEKSIYKKIIKNNIKIFKNLESMNSINFLNKHYLILAEYYKNLQNHFKSKFYYEKAIDCADKNGLLHENGLSKEFYGKYCFEYGLKLLGTDLILQAYNDFNRWGSKSIISKLINNYPEINFKKDDTLLYSTNRLDTEAILKTYKILSGEIEIDQLLKKLIKILFRSSGASRGVILLKEDELLVRCVGKIDDRKTRLCSIPYYKYDEIPITIIEDVYFQLKNVVIDCAGNCEEYNSDPYFKVHNIKSIFCIPILNKSKLAGVLYLENSLLENAFNDRIFNIITMISSQIAISIETALLYNSIEQSEEKFKTLVDSLSDGVFIIQDERFQYVNKSALKILGYQEDDLIGKRFIEFVEYGYRELVQYNHLQRITGETLIKEYEIEIIRSDGSKIPVSLSSGLINYNNRPAIEGSIKDISDRRAIEEMQSNYREHLKELVSQKTENLKNLLDNSDQGFLTINKDFKIIGEYSQECLNIYGKEIDNLNFIDLTFKNYLKNETTLIYKTLKKIFEEENSLKIDVYISLMPKLIRLDRKYIELKYKFLIDRYELLVIMTDITEKKKLQKDMDKERNNLKMVIKAITDSNSVKRSIDDYKHFVQKTLYEIINNSNNIDETLIELYREIHTFKGDLSQWSMSYISQKLTELESELSKIINTHKHFEDKNKIIDFFNKFDLIGWIEREEKFINDKVGRNIFRDDEIVINLKVDLLNIEKYILSNFSYEEYKELLPRIRRLRYVNLVDIIRPYDEYIQQLSENLYKKINPIKIFGEEIFIDRDIYHNFTKTLIHIFRNIIDHGIESPDERLAKKKSEAGNIKCRLSTENNKLIIEITDDGRGLDFDKIEKKALELNLISKAKLTNMNENEIAQLIFADRLSTRKKATEISGRGLGLSALKKEINKLDGLIYTFNNNDDSGGCGFYIELPIIETHNNYDIEINVLTDILSMHLISFFFENIGLDFKKTDEFLINFDPIILSKISSFISIKGMIFGEVIITMEEQLAKKITQTFLFEDVPENEEKELTKASISEILNVIVGNSMQEFAEKGILVNIDSPIIMYGDNTEINYNSKGGIAQRYSSNSGNIELLFLNNNS